MKKGKIHISRLLFSAAIAIVIFYIVAQETFLFFWRFNLFSQQHWLHILTRWENGWVLRKPKEVFFFIGLLSLIPAYFGVWFLVYVFPLKKVLFFPKTYFEKKKKAKLQAQSLAAALGPANKQEILNAKKEPEKVIKISSQKMQQIDQLRGKGSSHAPTHTATPPAQNNAANEALDRFAQWEKLNKTVEAENIFVLRKMNIRSFPVNLLAITQEGAFLMCEGPEKGTTWETREDLSPPVWKTETGESIPSPLTAMVKAKSVLEKYLHEQNPEYKDLIVNCCMIMDHGHITNVNALLPFLEEWDISILRMGSCKTPDLPDTAALIEYIKTQKPSSQALNDAVAIALLDLMDTENGE